MLILKYFLLSITTGAWLLLLAPSSLLSPPNPDALVFKYPSYYY